MLSCMIVVIVTCYLNDVLCGIVIKMCYLFAFMWHNVYEFLKINCNYELKKHMKFL
jgi:hypothetical protein